MDRTKIRSKMQENTKLLSLKYIVDKGVYELKHEIVSLKSVIGLDVSGYPV